MLSNRRYRMGSHGVRVIVAKRADTCRECGKAIEAGTRINYGGPGAVTHENCRALAVVTNRYGSAIYGGHSATGSRCIDAPCCGCCD
jgi:hypothetical protein